MIKRAPKERRTDHSTGEVFDSAGELGRWLQLRELARVGAITELKRQVVFPLFAARITGTKLLDKPVAHSDVINVTAAAIKIRSGRYPAGRSSRITLDFAYRENGFQIYEDWKGLMTEAARLRIGIFEAGYNAEVRISGPAVMRKGGRKPVAFTNRSR